MTNTILVALYIVMIVAGAIGVVTNDRRLYGASIAISLFLLVMMLINHK